MEGRRFDGDFSTDKERGAVVRIAHPFSLKMKRSLFSNATMLTRVNVLVAGPHVRLVLKGLHGIWCFVVVEGWSLKVEG